MGEDSRQTFATLALEAQTYSNASINAARLEGRLQASLESVLLFEHADLLLLSLGSAGRKCLCGEGS